MRLPKDIIEWSVIIPIPLTILINILNFCYVPMIYQAGVSILSIGLTMIIWFVGAIMAERNK